MVRRFAEPLGAESEVAQAQHLLRCLSPTSAVDVARATQAAEAALRRTRLCLGDVTEPSQAVCSTLAKCRSTCESIVDILGVQSVQSVQCRC